MTTAIFPVAESGPAIPQQRQVSRELEISVAAGRGSQIVDVTVSVAVALVSAILVAPILLVFASYVNLW